MAKAKSENRGTLIIQTGGTIDKDYPKSVGGYAFEIGEPAVQKILCRARLAIQVEYVTVCRKDSQDITDGDRASVLEVCTKTVKQNILITHGTDTMIETARYLGKRQPPDKIIVLTGAHKPETFKASEADFNVGFALGSLHQLNTPGVYLAMNGALHSWNSVTRDENTGEFIPVQR